MVFGAVGVVNRSRLFAGKPEAARRAGRVNAGFAFLENLTRFFFCFFVSKNIFMVWQRALRARC